MTTQVIASEVAAAVAFELVKAERTKKWLAEKTGIAYSTLCRKLDGHVEFTFSELFKIAAALGVEPASFVPERFKAVA